MNNGSPVDHLSPESKVGLFVLAGMAVLMISILMLGDIHFRPQNNYYATFNNIEGITDKSPVKVFGVEVGSVKKVDLEDGRARVTIGLGKGISVYRNATMRIRSTGIIGSKFIALDPGRAEPGTPPEDQRLHSGDAILGKDTLSIDELMERVAKSLDDVTGGGKLGSNLNATMENLRHITDSLNAALGQQRQALVNIVKNVEEFSAHARSVAVHLDDVMTSSKEEIKTAIHELKETMQKTNNLLSGVEKGNGVLGTLLVDKQAGDEIKETVTNLKHTSESAKQILSRYTKMRAFWIVQGRYDFKADIGRGDVGLRLEPRPNKFYEIMGQNLRSSGSSNTSDQDFERPNELTAIIGRHWGTFTGAVGLIKSRGGVEARFRPFQETTVPVLNRLELVGQGSDWGRDAVINERHMTHPNYMAGARIKVNDLVTIGAQAEDIAETTDVHGLVNVSFEDKDIAYLLGFVTFAH